MDLLNCMLKFLFIDQTSSLGQPHPAIGPARNSLVVVPYKSGLCPLDDCCRYLCAPFIGHNQLRTDIDVGARAMNKTSYKASHHESSIKMLDTSTFSSCHG